MNGMATDMWSLWETYILGGTAYACDMKEFIDNDKPINTTMKAMGVDWNNKLLQFLYDKRQLPWDDDLKGKYVNVEKITPREITQLQLLSDLIFNYFAEQMDYIPKTWTKEQQEAHMIPPGDWEQKKNKEFTRGMDHYMRLYPHTTSLSTATGPITKALAELKHYY